MSPDTATCWRYIPFKFNAGGVGLAVYKLAAPRKAFYLVPICHAITDPPVTKIRLWAAFGV